MSFERRWTPWAPQARAMSVREFIRKNSFQFLVLGSQTLDCRPGQGFEFVGGEIFLA